MLGPFNPFEMQDWMDNGFFPPELNIKHTTNPQFMSVGQFVQVYGQHQPFLRELHMLEQKFNVYQANNTINNTTNNMNNLNINTMNHINSNASHFDTDNAINDMNNIQLSYTQPIQSTSISPASITQNQVEDPNHYHPVEQSNPSPVEVQREPRKWSTDISPIAQPSLSDIQLSDSAAQKIRASKVSQKKQALLVQETNRLNAEEDKRIAMQPIQHTGNPWGDQKFRQDVSIKQDFLQGEKSNASKPTDWRGIAQGSAVKSTNPTVKQPPMYTIQLTSNTQDQ